MVRDRWRGPGRYLPCPSAIAESPRGAPVVTESAASFGEWCVMHHRLGNAVTAAVVAAAVGWSARSVWQSRTKDGRTSIEPWRRVADWSAYASEGVRDGASSASVTIVVFSDYLCGACALLDGRLDSLIAKYGKDLVVVRRNLPLKPGAVGAAMAAICGRRAGKFEAVRRALFGHSADLGRVSWSTMAQAAGVSDTNAFAECLGDEETSRELRADVAAAEALGTSSAPTILINGDLYPGLPPDLAEIVARKVDSARANRLRSRE